MRQTIAGLIAGAAFAATVATAAPAQACAWTEPCGNYGYYAYGSYDYGYSAYGCGYGGCGYGGCGYGGYGYGGCGVRERLPEPGDYQTYASPQYYWVNQGPTYTGPGNFAPVPTYQERAVTGSRYDGRPYRYRYGYDGGPYGNATNHYYDGAPGVQGPVVYTYRDGRLYQRSQYRPRRPAAPKYYYTQRHGHRYGNAQRSYNHSMASVPRAQRVTRD